MKKNYQNQQGMSTLEILLAFAILILTITAVLQMGFGNQSIRVDSETSSEALSKASDMLETTRIISKQDFYSLNSIPTVTDDIYQKSLTVKDINSYTKEVTANISWLTDGQRNPFIKLVTLLTNPVVAAGGDTCNPTLDGDWSNPKLLGSADVGENNGATDVDVLARKAYVTSNPSDTNKSDFYIVDIADPLVSNLPILNAGGLNTGPGLAAIHVAGDYAYVANISTENQLQIINISNPTVPFIEKELDLTAPSDNSVGNSIYYLSNKVYLGLASSTGPELYVIDVSDPQNMSTGSIKASFEINTDINSIIVKNNIAYLTVADDPLTPTQFEQLKILNVAQANNGIISQINYFANNPSAMYGNGIYISKNGNTLYLGEAGINNSNKSQFYSLDVTNSAINPLPILKEKYIDTSNNVAINAITVRSNLAFLWTSDPNRGFQIWDLNNLNSPEPYAYLNTQQTATGGFDCDGNLLYTAQRSNKALQIIGPTVVKKNPSLVLKIFNSSNNQEVNSVSPGTAIYAGVSASGSLGVPTGTVSFTLYENKTNCVGGPTTSYSNIDLVSGAAKTTNFVTLPNKSISYIVNYGGDLNYNSQISQCVPLNVI